MIRSEKDVVQIYQPVERLWQAGSGIEGFWLGLARSLVLIGKPEEHLAGA